MSSIQHKSTDANSLNKWSPKEDDLLLKLKSEGRSATYSRICKFFPGRSPKQILTRFKALTKNSGRYWCREDDLRLCKLTETYGENFIKLSEFFRGKTAQDLEARYYKKIKRSLLEFTPEEDAILLKINENPQQLKVLKHKGDFHIDKRLKYLLYSKTVKEKSFNNSYVTSSHSSSLSSINEEVTEIVIDQANPANSVICHKDNLSLDMGYSQDACFQTMDSCELNYFSSQESFELEKKLQHDILKENINKFYMGNILSDHLLIPTDDKESYLQQLDQIDESHDKFESSFYTAFKNVNFKYFLEPNQVSSDDKELNFSNNTCSMEFWSKRMKAEQILGNESDSLKNLSESPAFKELYQSLNKNEEECIIAYQTHKNANQKWLDSVNLVSSQMQMNELSFEIDLLLRLIKVKKLKLNLFRNAMLNEA